MLDIIPITVHYSNAVLVAVLPLISQFAQKLELSLPTPITISQVQTFNVSDERENMGGCVTLKNGYMFWYEHGHVQCFRTPRSYFALQDPQRIPSFYGPLKLNETQAIALARSYIRKLGYTEDMLYADLDPKVTPPPNFHGNTIPHYKIEWEAPNRDALTSVAIEIDGANKQAVSIYFSNLNLWQDPPASLAGLLPPLSNKPPSLVFATNEILTKITVYARRLQLPIQLPINANQISALNLGELENKIYGYIQLTNNFSFRCYAGDISGFIAPDVFFTWQHEVRVKDFISETKLNQKQLTALVRTAIDKLGYPAGTFDLDQKPEIEYPRGVLKDKIPRLEMEWTNKDKDGEVSFIRAEVDAGSGIIKSLTLFNRKGVGPQY